MTPFKKILYVRMSIFGNFANLYLQKFNIEIAECFRLGWSLIALKKSNSKALWSILMLYICQTLIKQSSRRVPFWTNLYFWQILEYLKHLQTKTSENNLALWKEGHCLLLVVLISNSLIVDKRESNQSIRLDLRSLFFLNILWHVIHSVGPGGMDH